jgi:chitinase
MVGYYTSWSQDRPGDARFLPEHIDPSLFTTIVFAFAKIDQQGQLAEPNENERYLYEPLYRRVLALKEKNSSLKVLLAVGGGELGAGPFSFMACDKGRRDLFVKNTVKYLTENGFDGLDLDWVKISIE